MPTAAPNPQRAVSRVLTVVWLAIMLGIVVQVLVLLGKTSAGAPFPGLKWLPDQLNGVTWAVFVCAGVVLGSIATRARSVVMGVRWRGRVGQHHRLDHGEPGQG